MKNKDERITLIVWSSLYSRETLPLFPGPSVLQHIYRWKFSFSAGSNWNDGRDCVSLRLHLSFFNHSDLFILCQPSPSDLLSLIFDECTLSFSSSSLSSPPGGFVPALFFVVFELLSVPLTFILETWWSFLYYFAQKLLTLHHPLSTHGVFVRPLTPPHHPPLTPALSSLPLISPAVWTLDWQAPVGLRGDREQL